MDRASVLGIVKNSHSRSDDGYIKESLNGWRPDVASLRVTEFKNRSVHICAFPVIEQPQVELVIRECAAVAEDDQFAAGSGEGDVGAAGVRQEAQFGGGVRANERDHDCFLFSPLKAIGGKQKGEAERRGSRKGTGPFTEGIPC